MSEGQALIPETDDGLLSEPEFARALDYSPQAVAKRREKGDITPRRVEKRGRLEYRYYDRAQLDDAKKNWGIPGNGGRRPGAGRPRQRRVEPDRLPRNTIEAAALGQEVRERGEPPPGAMAGKDLLYCTRDELVAYLTLCDHDPARLPASLIGKLKNLEEIRERRIKTDTTLGRLVPAEQIEDAWGSECRAVLATLDGVPARVADRVSRLAAPDQSERQKMRDLLLAHDPPIDPDTIEAVMALTVAPDIHAAVRQVVATEIQSACAALGSRPD